MMRMLSAAALAAAFTIPAHAQAPIQAQPMSVVQPGDNMMSCQQIVAAAQQQQIAMGVDPNAAAEAGMGMALAESGAALAYQGAVAAGADYATRSRIGAIGGMIGNVARAGRQQDQAQQAQTAMIAQQRWWFLNGLYMGRDCDQVLYGDQPLVTEQ